MEKTPDISIVIVNYNVKDLLVKCLASSSHFLKEIITETIVIDNASTDGSAEEVQKKFPSVKIITNKQNAGFPAANNQGFYLSKGKYILMLNPDTEWMDNSINKMFEYMEKHDIEMLAPKLLNTNHTLQDSAWRFPTLFSVFCDSFHLSGLSGKKNYSDKSRDAIFQADSCSGAALFFRKEIIHTIGALDEKLFWIEDVDFCYRAKKVGLKLIYFPEASILHHSGQSAKKNYTISISNQVFNKIKFFKKHHSSTHVVVVIAISFISVILKIILFGLLSSFHSIYFRKFKAYCYTAPKIFNPPIKIS